MKAIRERARRRRSESGFSQKHQNRTSSFALAGRGMAIIAVAGLFAFGFSAHQQGTQSPQAESDYVSQSAMDGIKVEIGAPAVAAVEPVGVGHNPSAGLKSASDLMFETADNVADASSIFPHGADAPAEIAEVITDMETAPPPLAAAFSEDFDHAVALSVRVEALPVAPANSLAATSASAGKSNDVRSNDAANRSGFVPAWSPYGVSDISELEMGLTTPVLAQEPFEARPMPRRRNAATAIIEVKPANKAPQGQATDNRKSPQARSAPIDAQVVATTRRVQPPPPTPTVRPALSRLNEPGARLTRDRDYPGWRQYAVSLERPVRQPAIAIIIDDLGLSRSKARQTSELPGPLTLSFLPYARHLPDQTRIARDFGHELMVHMPMEPDNPLVDPGPNALLTELSPADVAVRLKRNLAKFPDYVGINNHMGSRFTRDVTGMRVVLKELARRGLLFIDSKTTADSVVGEVSHEVGLPQVSRDVFLDPDGPGSNVVGQLRKLEKIAKRRGYAVAVGHPYPVTLSALKDWLPTAQSRGFDLVPISAIVRLRYHREEIAEAPQKVTEVKYPIARHVLAAFAEDQRR